MYANPMYIIIGIIAAIVGIGLAILLIWKLLTSIKDAREYKQWRKEVQTAKWETVSDHEHHGNSCEICSIPFSILLLGRQSSLQERHFNFPKPDIQGWQANIAVVMTRHLFLSTLGSAIHTRLFSTKCTIKHFIARTPNGDF